MIFSGSPSHQQRQPRDPALPLTGKRWYLLFNGATGNNLVGGPWANAGSGLATSVDQIQHELFRGPASTTSNRNFPIASFSDDAPWTLAFRFLRPSGVPESRALLVISSSLNDGWIRIGESSTGGVGYTIRANGANGRITGGQLTGGTHDAVLTYDSATLSFWLDGALVGTYSSSTMGSAARANIYIGDGSFQFSKVQGYSYVAFFAGAIGANEIADLKSHPWHQLIDPSVDDMVWPSAAPPGGSVFNPLSGRGGAAAQPLYH